MRGKQAVKLRDVRHAGITPAHAGKTCSVTPLRCGERDHPRACGENRASGAESGMRTGSPPRMRGKRLVLPRWRRRYGITPAHAGKTKQVDRFAHCFRDHPRACGENFQRAESEKARLGSPPRMRGKQFSNPSCPLHPGITPAHAGKTQHSSFQVAMLRDHPRACGENNPPVAAPAP